MITKKLSAGFSLVELLIASTIFTFIVSGVTGLFIQALDLQRRAIDIQKIQENSQYIMETISREIRVSKITSGDTACSPPDSDATAQLVIDHPVNGIVTYEYNAEKGALLRNGQAITSRDVSVKQLAFCVRGSGLDGVQSRVTIPMTLESMAGKASNRVTVSFQTTVVSRDLTTDLTP